MKTLPEIPELRYIRDTVKLMAKRIKEDIAKREADGGVDEHKKIKLQNLNYLRMMARTFGDFILGYGQKPKGEKNPPPPALFERGKGVAQAQPVKNENVAQLFTKDKAPKEVKKPVINNEDVADLNFKSKVASEDVVEEEKGNPNKKVIASSATKKRKTPARKNKKIAKPPVPKK